MPVDLGSEVYTGLEDMLHLRRMLIAPIRQVHPLSDAGALD